MRTFVVASAAILLFAGPADAQQGSSEIIGRIVDEQGGVVPGVTVTLTNEQTGGFRTTTSSSDGTYGAPQIGPGLYRLVATRAGFRTVDRPGLLVRVGETLTVDVKLEVGNREDRVIVTGEAPLIDRASVQVGGHVGTAELTGLPLMNRSYLAAVALLPGMWFLGSGQMGDDSVIANGQHPQNNAISVDGGYNTDDAAGSTFGAQVRPPLEALQEVQAITSMYEAEHGRSGAAVINAVTKQGTNSFTGVAFAYLGSHHLTAKDLLVKTEDLPKPETSRREWGGVAGGPIVKNKAHFFVSLERQVDKPSRTSSLPERPLDGSTVEGSKTWSVVQDRTTWNVFARVDHQINANHAWAVRWLREDSSQHPTVNPKATRETFGDETDRDQMASGTLTSVFGNSRVNTLRAARTWEHWWQGNECFREKGPNNEWTGFDFGKEAAGDQAACPPQLEYQTFWAQAHLAAQGVWDSNYQIEDHFSWFLPNRKGSHDLKVGGRYNNTEFRQVSQRNMNGTFSYQFTDRYLPFDSANPRTYPERLTIRIPGAYDATMTDHTVELYVQDKWQMGAKTTLLAGVRYDLEIIPMNETDNPLFSAGQRYPIDRNNIAPRLGVTRLFGGGKSLVRAGYGVFYHRTLLGVLQQALESPKFSTSINASFPNNAADPGPKNGKFPTDPLLVNGPFIDKELLNQLFPPGRALRNTGVVVFDSPNRKQPFSHQFSLGYSRELARLLGVHADYVHINNEQLFLSRNLNPGRRADTTSRSPVLRENAFGVLDERYSQRVWGLENNGRSVYDGMNIQLERRYAGQWSARASYSLSFSRGTASTQNDKNTDQVLTDQHLDERWGPTLADRRHILAISARAKVPKTGGMMIAGAARYMSGMPFTMFNSDIDEDRNGELDDPLPTGSYSGTAPNALRDVKYKGGRYGAYGPDYFQLDLRAGWQRRIAKRTLELFVDIYNLTNRTHFDNPTNTVPNIGADRRLSDFLVPRLLGGSGFPRQAQLGLRYAF